MSTPVLGHIGQVALSVRDLDRATAFYRDTLGLPFLFAAPPGLAFFQCGHVRLMLAQPEGSEPARPGSMLYFVVADIIAAHAELWTRGVRFAEVPHVVHRAGDYELWLASFEDSEGNPLALMHEKRS